jgi:hypothetical protein
MYRHIVMWNVAGETREAKQRNIERLTHSFLSLRGRIPGLLHLEIGHEDKATHLAQELSIARKQITELFTRVERLERLLKSDQKVTLKVLSDRF